MPSERHNSESCASWRPPVGQALLPVRVCGDDIERNKLTNYQTTGRFSHPTHFFYANRVVSLGILALNAIPLRIVHFYRAEQGGLRLQLCAVAHDYDLRVGGIEIFLRGVENVSGCETQNAFTIGFQVILWQPFQRGRGELPG